MKKLLLSAAVLGLLSGCVYEPVHDYGHYPYGGGAYGHDDGRDTRRDNHERRDDRQMDRRDDRQMERRDERRDDRRDERRGDREQRGFGQGHEDR